MQPRLGSQLPNKKFFYLLLSILQQKTVSPNFLGDYKRKKKNTICVLKG